MKYEFYNSGTVFSFNPSRVVYDIRETNKKCNALDFHSELVREANRLDCFITDDKGKVIVKSNKPLTHIRADWRKVVKKKK